MALLQNRFSVLADDYQPEISPEPTVPNNGPIHGYRVLSNGNIENNSTLYVVTGVAHKVQVEQIFEQAINDAKTLIPSLNCSVHINFLLKQNSYAGIAYVDVSHPSVYYMLLGMNPDGSDRYEWVDDPDYQPDASSTCWADQVETVKIMKELPSLISLQQFKYDEHQKAHLNTHEEYGQITVSPAFMAPIPDNVKPNVLFIQDFPDELDLNFIFSRYARSISSNKYPRIKIGQSRNKTPIAEVTYSHAYDAGFALMMLKKYRGEHNGEQFIMTARYAKKTDR